MQANQQNVNKSSKSYKKLIGIFKKYICIISSLSIPIGENQQTLGSLAIGKQLPMRMLLFTDGERPTMSG